MNVIGQISKETYTLNLLNKMNFQINTVDVFHQNGYADGPSRDSDHKRVAIILYVRTVKNEKL